MSYECSECGRDLRKGHSEYCSRWRPLQDHPEEKLIDAEPTWESLLWRLVEDSQLADLALTVEIRDLAKQELLKMARAADAYRALQKAGKLP